MKRTKEKRKEYRKKHLAKIKIEQEYWDNYKLTKGCSICGYNKCARALDFHHNGDKTESISRLIRGTLDREKVTIEVNKCIVVCANCHRELHI